MAGETKTGEVLATYENGPAKYVLTTTQVACETPQPSRNWSLPLEQIRAVELQRRGPGARICLLQPVTGPSRNLVASATSQPDGYAPFVEALHAQVARQGREVSFMRGSNLGWSLTYTTVPVYLLLGAFALFFLLTGKFSVNTLYIVAVGVGIAVRNQATNRMNKINGKRAPYDPAALPPELVSAAPPAVPASVAPSA